MEQTDVTEYDIKFNFDKFLSKADEYLVENEHEIIQLLGGIRNVLTLLSKYSNASNEDSLISTDHDAITEILIEPLTDDTPKPTMKHVPTLSMTSTSTTTITNQNDTTSALSTVYTCTPQHHKRTSFQNLFIPNK